jgi:hypothetical protein
MKKLYFLVVALCVFDGLNAQIVNIPDANLKYLLVNSVCADFNNDGVFDGDVDANNDGEIQELEALNVLQLSVDCSGTNINFYDKRIISNLTGINSFVNIKKVKWTAVEFNNIEINLSQLSKLEYILIQWTNSSLITSINLSNLTKLVALDLIGIRPINNEVPNHNINVNLGGAINLTNLNYTNSFLNFDFCQIPNLINLNCFYLEGGEPDVFDFSCLTKLETLDINENWIKTIILKNGSLLKSINWHPTYYYYYPEYICLDENSQELEQILQLKVAGPQTVINTYCSFNPGGTFYNIQGNNKLDVNNNGCDALDVNYSNLKFTLLDGITTGSFISNSTGNYSIPVQTGTHSITPVLENPSYFNVSPSTVSVNFPTQTSPFVQDYCITVNGVHPDLEVSILPLRPAVPGFDAKYKLVYKNKGNQTQSGTVNLSFDDAVVDLVGAIPVTTTQTTNTLSWDFTNLLPFETRAITFTLNVNSPMETPAVNSGSVLVYNATITSTVTDETPLDNTFAYNQTVVNSFDPNDKTCLEGSIVSPSLIGQYVHYIIRFENNGTANAQNIVVKDMIDLSKFDLSTLIPTNASHSFVTNISAGNKVEFIFENINLPFDDANNDGYIAFKIKTKPTLVVNDIFTNDASIYFDYNFPIVTKLASSTFKTLETQDFEFANYFTLYPNPAKSVLNISSKETIEVKSISIYNTLGQLVLVIPNAEKVSKIDVSSLTVGNYFIKINSDKGTSNTRFIKE